MSARWRVAEYAYNVEVQGRVELAVYGTTGRVRDAALGSLANFAHEEARGGLNFVLAGPGSGVACVQMGCLMLYPDGRSRADDNTLDHPLPGPPSYVGAHEVGHLFGFADAYSSDDWSSLPGYTSNIMGNTDRDHLAHPFRVFGEPAFVPGRNPWPDPNYRVERRPWLGLTQVRHLAEAILVAARNTDRLGGAPIPRGDGVARGLNAARPFVESYVDQRPRRDSRWSVFR